MYRASKNVSFVYLGSICCHGNPIVKECLLLFWEKLQEVTKINLMLASNVKCCFRFGISSWNLSSEPNLSHSRPEIKNCEISKEKGA